MSPAGIEWKHHWDASTACGHRIGNKNIFWSRLVT